jgi:hypothetical protein
MKNILIIAILILSSTYMFSQGNVPDAIKTKFATLYPGVKVTEWEIGDGLYEASFVENKIETSVLLTSDGRVAQTETEIAFNLLPQGVNDYIAAQLNGKKINEASKITRSDGMVTYKVEINDTDYIFDEMGHYLTQITEDDDDEDDDNDD